MKIVMLCRLYWPHKGGVEKHVAGIAREMVHAGHTVDIFTTKHEKNLPSFEIREGIKIHRKPDQKTILRLAMLAQDDRVRERLEIWSWLFMHIRIFVEADVIHIHDVFFWYWPIRLLLPWKKVFITFHGFEAGFLPTAKAKRARQLAARWTTGNLAVGTWIEKWYGTKANVVTYGAGECKPTFNLPRRQAGSQLKAVFIGRMADDTGAQIYKKVCESLPNVKLDLFGEGSAQGTIDDSCAVFPSYDIACVSSYLSIIEAMQCRVLVVAYAVNDLKWDYLHSHPRAADMYIVKSEEELKKTILRLSGQARGAQDDKIASAYDWAKQQTWHRVYQKYVKLWGIQ